jgi:spore coat polysaccharide biosynthesis predicted glycosyltransferase SpsG
MRACLSPCVNASMHACLNESVRACMLACNACVSVSMHAILRACLLELPCMLLCVPANVPDSKCKRRKFRCTTNSSFAYHGLAWACSLWRENSDVHTQQRASQSESKLMHINIRTIRRCQVRHK